jgi:hypothetical protein
MANLTHTYEKSDSLAKEFDFVTEETLARYSATHKTARPAATASSVSVFEREALQQFHEEFKKLVLASNHVYCQNEELAWEDTTLQTLIEPHEIEWLDWRLKDPNTILEVPELATAPQQIIKPIAGPRPGTPPPVEPWLVKTIALLVVLNLLFAALIVSGTRINDWLHKL